MTAVTPCLWFDNEAEEAARFYVSLFDNSRVTEVSRYGEAGPKPAGSVLLVHFELDGRPFQALNGGPEYHFTEAVSLSVPCPTQREVDHYWDALVAGGEAGRCGWLKDRFGLSWQIVPDELPALLADPDPGRAQRAMTAMLTMSKLDIAAMRRAADEV
jgi:predicted 3-demethylubiquinone-9 3-methyltransferase (glyoxalase superfamily)